MRDAILASKFNSRQLFFCETPTAPVSPEAGFRNKAFPPELLKSFQSRYKSGRIKKRAAHSEKFSAGRTGMHGKSRVSSAIKYDCFKLDGSGN